MLPLAVRVLGEDLVVFRDTNEKYLTDMAKGVKDIVRNHLFIGGLDADWWHVASSIRDLETALQTP